MYYLSLSLEAFSYLVWVPPKVELETRAWVPVVDLEGDPRSEGNRENEARKEEEPIKMCLTQVTNVGNGHSVLPGFPERYTEHFPKYGRWNINPQKLKSFKINVVLALEKILL